MRVEYFHKNDNYTMAQSRDSVAYSGGPPGAYPRTNLFDFIFGNPFHSDSAPIAPSQRLAPIDPGQAIFIDNKTGELAGI